MNSRVNKINELIEKYRISSDSFPNIQIQNPPQTHTSSSSESPSTDVVVLVTGTTGSLGSYVLSFLLDSPDVSKIYAVNRISNKGLKARQAQAFVDKGLNPRRLEDTRLSLLVVDLESENFGLGGEVYEEIQRAITIIIHLAWPVNFIQPMDRFESNIRGSCNLMKFALSSPNASIIRFLFASSISTTLVWKELRPVPEEVLKDVRCTVGFGYAEAKYVVDRVLEETPLNSTSLRIGQLCGSKRNGAWPIEEWMPLLVKTGLTLKSMPAHFGSVSWLPVDMVGRYTVDIALSSSQERYPAMFNITSPTSITCHRANELINSALCQEKLITSPLKEIPSSEWVDLLVQYSESSGPNAAETAPLIKLLKPFQMMILASQFAVQNLPPKIYASREFALFGPFDTSNTKKWSLSFRETKELNERDSLEWVRYWKDRRFIGTESVGGGGVSARL